MNGFWFFTFDIKVSLIMYAWSHSKSHRFRTSIIHLPDGCRNLELNKAVVPGLTEYPRMMPVLAWSQFIHRLSLIDVACGTALEIKNAVGDMSVKV